MEPARTRTEFEFATAGRILFGQGCAAKLAGEAAGLGKRALVLTGSSRRRWSGLVDEIERAGTECRIFSVQDEPTVELVRLALDLARDGEPCDTVVAIGGGSVIDTGKAVAAMLTNPGRIEDYLEVVGAGQPLTERPAPCIAVPTTAGTGAEVTRNAVLGVPSMGVKVSLRSPLMLPVLALVDPLLTRGLPPGVTAVSGLDALTQLLEAFVSKRANPFTDSLCREGLARAGRSLVRAFRDGSDSAAREDMALAALFSGLALANAGLGAVHGIAGPLGGMIGAPHGTICAALLPHVTRANIRALERSGHNSTALVRYLEAVRLITENGGDSLESGINRIEALCRELGVKGLASLGLHQGIIPEAVEKSRRASSMKGNPVELSSGELTEVLEKSM